MDIGVTGAGHVSYPASKQAVYEDGSILGMTSYRMFPSAGSGHTVHSPDSSCATAKLDRAQLSDWKDRTFYYRFVGWRSELGSILSPGDFIAMSDLTLYDANGDQTVTLDAVWTILDAAGRIDSANFYLSLDCEIADNMSNGFQGTPTHNFTRAVYSTPVLGTDGLGGDPSTGLLLIAPPTSEDTAYEVDSRIRASKTQPISGVSLGSTPSDESVLAALRSGGYTITIDGAEIPVDKITSENFTVRWSSMKYEYFDSWHVDGVLVIAAHNYRQHFARLSALVPGDLIRLTDADGNVHDYTVAQTETLGGGAAAEMTDGRWDLTLFTCTYGGGSRLTVRCIQAE